MKTVPALAGGVDFTWYILRVVGEEILLPVFEFALDVVKALSKEELMQLKILNNADFPEFGKLLGGGN